MDTIKIPDPLYVRCSCYGEGLMVETDLEENNWFRLDISFWHRGFSNPTYLSLKDKIRFCWRIITKDRPYGDMVCLNIEETLKLRDYINEQIEMQQKIGRK